MKVTSRYGASDRDCLPYERTSLAALSEANAAAATLEPVFRPHAACIEGLMVAGGPSAHRRVLHCARCYTILHRAMQVELRMDDHIAANEATPKVRRAGSRDAIVDAAERLFLERGFGAVSMDDLAEAAGVARRTLYNQFASKEEIFREMLPRVSGQLEDLLPPGIETQGDVEDVLRLIAEAILALHGQQKYLGFFRMVVAESRQFPWITEAFAAVMEPQMERLARYFAHLTAVGILTCRNALLAAHQFAGILNEFFLWPWMMGRRSTPVPVHVVIEEAIRMFLQRYRCPPTKGSRRPAENVSARAFPETVSVPPVRSAVHKQPRRSRRTSPKRHLA